MNKYVVKVSSIFSNIINVEAEDEDMAKVKAKDFLESRENSDKEEPMRHYYESTFPPEHWSVITEDKYNELKAEIQKSIEGSSQDDGGEVSNIITPNIITP
jgi:hypothetical protein